MSGPLFGIDMTVDGKGDETTCYMAITDLRDSGVEATMKMPLRRDTMDVVIALGDALPRMLLEGMTEALKAMGGDE